MLKKGFLLVRFCKIPEIFYKNQGKLESSTPVRIWMLSGSENLQKSFVPA